MHGIQAAVESNLVGSVNEKTPRQSPVAFFNLTQVGLNGILPPPHCPENHTATLNNNRNRLIWVLFLRPKEKMVA
jgi:hypothetical protein